MLGDGPLWCMAIGDLSYVVMPTLVYGVLRL